MTPINDDQAAQLKAAAIAARRAARAPWQNAHVDRIIREREARETAKEYRQAKREAETATQPTKYCSKCRQRLPVSAFGRQSWCKQCAAAHARDRYYRLKGGTRGTPRGPVSPERQREAAERIAHLTALLMGTSVGERITSQEGWDMTTAQLQQLWHESGDKACSGCNTVVPPTAMMPPGPANFYPGKCRRCARMECEASHRRVYGPPIGPLPGPPRLPLRDGSSITLAEFARRVEERQKARN